MDYIFVFIMFALSFFFTIIAYYSNNLLFKIASGSILIFIGFMLITQGISVPSGSISNVSGLITTETTTFNTINDIYTNGVGIIVIILGLYFLVSSAFAFREREEEL